MIQRHTRETYGGNVIPRHPLYPRLLRRAHATSAPSTLTTITIQIISGMLIIAIITIITVGIVAYTTYQQIATSLTPRLDTLHNRDMFETSRIYDRNGILLYEFFDRGKRTNISISEVSPLVIYATIAIEDKTFFENSGVDYEGILRAFYQNVTIGEEASGASTITQQLIKNIILTDEERDFEQRYERKFKEIILAQEINKKYTKNEILELYLNEIYYGNLAYGIQAASEVYFESNARNLTLPQAALLSGLPQLPSKYDPSNYLQHDEEGSFLPGIVLGDGWLNADYVLPNTTSPPKWRQIAVLRQMVDEGYVPEEYARAAAAETLRFAKRNVPLHAPHFVFYVRNLLEEQYGKQLVSGGGLNIYTTLDLNLQNMVQEEAARHITSLADRNIHNAAVVVMQPHTGQILAMVGSVDYNAVISTKTDGETGNVLDGQVNVALRERQPGSALKPFTYLAAMERGMTPADVLWDVPTEFPSGDGTWYAPKNYNGKWNGPVRIRAALANSLNMPAVKALRHAEIGYTLKLLHKVGITHGLNRGLSHYGLSLTLGGGEVTLLELTTAYNTLASGGRYVPATPILKIVDNNNNVKESFQLQPGQQVIAPDLNAIMVDMMSDDKARAPIWGLNSKLKLSRDAAVKTGTSNDWRDAWTLGFTPYVTVGVWSGNNNNEPTIYVESLEGGGIIWHNVMETIFQWIDNDEQYHRLLIEPSPGKLLPETFVLPDDGSVVRMPICPLPGSFGGNTEELFTRDMLLTMKQTTPNTTSSVAMQQSCDIYRTIDVIALPNNTYCQPVGNKTYDQTKRETLFIWKLPENDPTIRASYVWAGGSANTQQIHPPFCTDNMLGTPTPTPTPFIMPSPTPSATSSPIIEGAVRMPQLHGMGENQAKEALAALGVHEVFVDYQPRERIPELYDQYKPYAVVSTLPAPGNWILPGNTVILGIRAPDPANDNSSDRATPEPLATATTMIPPPRPTLPVVGIPPQPSVNIEQPLSASPEPTLVQEQPLAPPTPILLEPQS